MTPRSGQSEDTHAPTASRRRALHSALLKWYDAHARDLPWRQTRDPYRIWISEIMLQQTRVETGQGYYQRFLKRFPTLEVLARARQSSVLKLWEGLGYYTRARNLHAAARMVVRELGGAFPETVEGLLCLPGVGRYTAGAIASIAFEVPAAVVDGNVKRVLTRLFARAERIDSTAGETCLWMLAESLVHPRRPGDWNQALMELGARVCLPRSPRCTECPVAHDCEALKQDAVAMYPVRAPRKRVPKKEVVVAWLQSGSRVLVARRKPGGMLAGLWELPGGTVRPREGRGEALRRILQDELGINVVAGDRLAVVNHAYSHFTIRLHLLQTRPTEEPPGVDLPEAQVSSKGGYDAMQWVEPDALGRLAMPTADRKALRQAGEVPPPHPPP